MATQINLLNEPELPAPHEKLLRAPTFWEKYGWVKWVLIVAILVGIIDYGIIKVLTTVENAPLIEQQTSTIPSPPTSTADPTQSWNSYTSPLGKFSFKYPDGYTVTENAAKNSVHLASNKLPNGAEFVLTISFKAVTGEAELQTLVTKNPFCPAITSEKPGAAVLNGKQPAQLYVDTPCGKTPTSVIYTVNQNKLYIITVQSTSQFMEIKSYTDQIFSTLSFIETEPTKK